MTPQQGDRVLCVSHDTGGPARCLAVGEDDAPNWGTRRTLFIRGKYGCGQVWSKDYLALQWVERE